MKSDAFINYYGKPQVKFLMSLGEILPCDFDSVAMRLTMRVGIQRYMIGLRTYEHCLARFCLFEAVSVDGGGDAGLRDSQHADGDRVSGGDEIGHR